MYLLEWFHHFHSIGSDQHTDNDYDYRFYIKLQQMPSPAHRMQRLYYLFSLFPLTAFSLC